MKTGSLDQEPSRRRCWTATCYFSSGSRRRHCHGHRLPPQHARHICRRWLLCRPLRKLARMSKRKSTKAPSATIAVNRKARHDYFIEDRFEAGLALEGWEVKSLRAGRVNIQEGYVVIRNGEAWLVGANISPLPTAS